MSRVLLFSISLASLAALGAGVGLSLRGETQLTPPRQIEITGAQCDREVSVRGDETIVVKLPHKAGTPFMWRPTRPYPPGIRVVKEKFEPVEPEPKLLGGWETHVLEYQVSATLETPYTLELIFSDIAPDKAPKEGRLYLHEQEKRLDPYMRFRVKLVRK